MLITWGCHFLLSLLTLLSLTKVASSSSLYFISLVRENQAGEVGEFQVWARNSYYLLIVVVDLSLREEVTPDFGRIEQVGVQRVWSI